MSVRYEPLPRCRLARIAPCRLIYARNVKSIEAHNSKLTGSTQAVNAFADMLPEEFRARYASGLRSRNKQSHTVRITD